MTWTHDLEWEELVRSTVRNAGWPLGVETPKAYRDGLLAALVSREPYAPGDDRWHISVQHEERLPSWDEMVKAAHELRPGVPFVISVPPRSMWMNVNPNVLHLHEVKDANLIAQWRRNARGDEPT